MKVLVSSIVVFLLLGCSGENTQEAKKVAQETTQKVVENVKEMQEKSSDVLKEKVQEAAKKVEEVSSEIVKKTQETQADGSALYSACAGCHGADGSKAALGKSQVIQGWDAQKVKDALQGYKAGTYGGAMKGLMQGQVSKLNDSEIEALAEHVSQL